jgi:Na+-transporting methylmalonyl-CoA/oxaloacetate decarboxylase gamma subunit
MDNQFFIALSITVIGMGLVFSAIILLWGLMALLVRLARDPIVQKTALDEQPTEMDLKRQAAAAAVATALAQEASFEPHEFPLPPTALVSAWQAVMRSKILNKRGPAR